MNTIFAKGQKMIVRLNLEEFVGILRISERLGRGVLCTNYTILNQLNQSHILSSIQQVVDFSSPYYIIGTRTLLYIIHKLCELCKLIRFIELMSYVF